MTSRGFVLTGWSDEFIHQVGLGIFVPPDPRITYFLGQVEECPDTGRLHVQGWIRLSTPVRQRAVIRMFADLDEHVYVRPQRGNNDQARDYVTKEDTKRSGTLEWGTLPESGTRNDLLYVKSRLEEGATLMELFHEDECFAPLVKYNRGLQAAQQALQAGRDRAEVTVEALCGDPGVGKSYGVRLREPELFVLEPPNVGGGPVWWDGYDSEPAVLIDDYEGWMQWSQLLRVLDRYPVRVPVRGSSVPLAATRIYLTSNKMPRDWHPRRLDRFDALKRRLHKVYHCTGESFRLLPDWEV